MKAESRVTFGRISGIGGPFSLPVKENQRLLHSVNVERWQRSESCFCWGKLHSSKLGTSVFKLDVERTPFNQVHNLIKYITVSKGNDSRGG